MLSQVLRVLFWLFLGLLVVSYVMRDRLPPRSEILREVYREPIQEETNKQPFVATESGTDYLITPEYSYDLVGLVVSEYRTDSWFDYYHTRWGDTLNVKDVCVVWGTNATLGLYNQMSFKNGSYTCYFKTRDAATWNSFNQAQLSNNHLLAADPAVQEALYDVRRGDQIRLEGYLASYAHGSFSRGTSVTRTDTGNGACETIYISNIEILKEGNSGWRMLYNLSFYGLVGIGVLWLLMFVVHVQRMNARIAKYTEPR